MISKLARDDYEEMIERGYSPTLDDFDRLNCLALRMTDGAETTAANFPRIGWAGDIPFHQPTYQAFAWYLAYCERMPDVAEKDAAWFYALAHARETGAFDGLTAPAVISKRVSAWISSLPVTLDEIRRACRFAASGFDDAAAGKADGEEMPTAEDNLNALHARLTECAAFLGCDPAELEKETPARLNMLSRIAAAAKLGGEFDKPDRGRQMRDYDLARSEIYKRLRDEKLAKDLSEVDHG